METLARETNGEHAVHPRNPSDNLPEREGRGWMTRRAFLGTAGAGAVGLTLYAGEISRHELVTEHRSIAIENLPEPFDGMRIVQISDFHYAAYTEPFYIRRVVERVNALKPDIWCCSRATL